MCQCILFKDGSSFAGIGQSPDGKSKLEYTKSLPVEKIDNLGEVAAKYILDRGGKKLMREEINIEKEFTIFSTKTLSLDQKKLFDSKMEVEMSDFITIRENRLKNKSKEWNYILK